MTDDVPVSDFILTLSWIACIGLAAFGVYYKILKNAAKRQDEEEPLA